MLDNIVQFNGDRDTRDMLSNSKFFEGYSRWDEKKNRYETWDEAVSRVMNMHRKYYADKMTKELSDLIDEAELAYKDKLVLGAQRALQFGGEQIVKNPMRMYNCTSTYADRPDFFGEYFHTLLCGAGCGVSIQKIHTEKMPRIQNRTKQAKIFTPDDSIEGWADCANILMSSYFVGGGKHPEYEGRRVYFDLSKIRPKGSIISGGFKAPGPEPLRKALDKIEHLLQGLILKDITVLAPIHIYDISMHLADAVLSGGVRRSATIFLFDITDEEMMNAKTGNWFIDHPQRARSNNSAVILEGHTTKDQFDNLFERTKQFGEPGFIFLKKNSIVYNPCLSGDALVSVKDHDITVQGKVVAKGIQYQLSMKELERLYSEAKETGDIKLVPLALSRNLETGELEYKQILWAAKTRENTNVVKVTDTVSGKSVICTPDHKIYTKNRGYVEAKDLAPDDILDII